MQNRRAYRRFERHQTIKIKILPGTDKKKPYGRAFSCTSEDVSVGGIQFSTSREIDANDELTLQISFTRPNRTFLHKGRVVWVRHEEEKKSYRIGVFFTSDDPRTLIEWRKTVLALGQK